MQRSTPKVFLIGETRPMHNGLHQMLEEVGAPGWTSGNSTPPELLVEVAGRLCYRSWAPGLNPNVTKVREGNREYIGNILKQHHGSVLEHANTTVAFIGVSRIFTHELVRHRAGCAFSQESMRFVRMDDIPMYVPNLTNELGELSVILGKANATDPWTDETIDLDSNDAWVDHAKDTYENAMETITNLAENLISKFGKLLDTPGVPFHVKKTITSALRRLAPGGHTTNIIMTANHRAWRHMIEMRTSEGAEEEIRKVFDMVAHQFRDVYPALYQDMTIGVDGVCTFANSKV